VEFEINETSPVHGYVQLANQLREKIRAGEITGRLPSLTELCNDSGLSMSSVQHAVDVLKKEGLVYGVCGRGVFIRDQQ
jgi:GntR family transcriptional regulator